MGPLVSSHMQITIIYKKRKNTIGLSCDQEEKEVKIIGISGSIVGTKTRIAVEAVLDKLKAQHTNIEVELINLGDYQLVFSDGRDYRDYTGDTKTVIDKIMSADAYIIGTPIFQASIPGTLKNLLDLLPNTVFKNKIVGMLATGGTARHYLVLEQQLKPILSYMGAMLVPKYVFVEEKCFQNKAIIDDEVLLRLAKLGNDTLHMAAALKEIMKTQESAHLY